jgi:hypothetical protein
MNVLKFFPPPDFQTILKHREVTYHRAALFLNSKIEAQKLGIEPEKDLFSVMCMFPNSGLWILTLIQLDVQSKLLGCPPKRFPWKK